MYLYSFITADPIRLKRFVQRWNEAGIPAIRALALRILSDTIPDTNDVGKCQRRLLLNAVSNVDYFRLGYNIVAYEGQEKIV